MTTRHVPGLLALMFAATALVGCSSGGGTPSYTVSAGVEGMGGSIDADSLTAERGTTATFTVTADSGYVIETVSDTCGGEPFTGGSNILETVYTTGEVTEDCAVTATFSPAHEVTVSAGTGGSIAPDGSLWVKEGDTFSFAVSSEAASGHVIDTVGGSCGEPFTGTDNLAETTYTTAAVTAACEVTASFKLATYSITTQAAPGGSIAAGGTFTHGDPASFTATPASEAYAVADITGDCGGQFNAADGTYSIEAVEKDCTVTATFSLADGQTPLDMGFDIKQLTFSWPAVPGADSYRLMQDVGGYTSGEYHFSEVTEHLSLSGTEATLDIAVHLLDWPDTSFMVQACNAAGCVDSNKLATFDPLLHAHEWAASINPIGYVKAVEPVPVVGDVFGQAVAVSGDGNTLAVGAPVALITGTTSQAIAGRVHIYTRGGDGRWVHRTALVPNDDEAVQMFGGALALNGDGTVLAVGAPLKDAMDGENPVTDAGAAYLFTRNDAQSDAWTERLAVQGDVLSDNVKFGASVSLSHAGDVLAVGVESEGVGGGPTSGRVPTAGRATAAPRSVSKG